MAIVPASWAQYGYRRLGYLPEGTTTTSPTVLSSMLTGAGMYESTPDNWVRLRVRAKSGPKLNALELIDVLDNSNRSGSKNFSYIATHYKTKFITGQKKKIEIPDADLDGLLKDVQTNPNLAQGMENIGKAISFADADQLTRIMSNEVATWFFGKYTSGKIAVLQSFDEYETLAGGLRALYTYAQTDPKELLQAGINTFPTLRHWQQVSPLAFVKPALEIFNYLWYPHISGYQAGPVGLTFLFLFEPSEAYTPGIYPQSWLDIARTRADFATEDIDVDQALASDKSAAATKATHQRYLHKSGFTAEERLEFLKWYVEAVNRLTINVLDTCNYTKDDDVTADVEPVGAFEHFLTVQRVIHRTLECMSSRHVASAKGHALETADLYDTLSELFGNTTGATKFFKKLFTPVEARTLLSASIRQLPAPFGTYFSGVLDELYKDLLDTIIDSVWFTSKRKANQIWVRTASGSGIDAPESYDEFCGNLMRALRNSHHGYFTSGDKSKRPSRYLFLSDGNTPDSLSYIPVLWWLSYLVNQDMVGWKPMALSSFDDVAVGGKK